MTKRIGAIVMALLVTLSFQAVACQKDGVAYAEEKKEINVIIDGTALVFSGDDGMGIPFIDSVGRVQVPIRKALEKIGATVSFETDPGSGERNIIISKDGSVIKLIAEDSIMRVNTDTLYLLDSSPHIIAGRTYMPIRAVSEVLGYSVSWDGASKSVLIQENQDVPLPQPAITPVGQFELPQYKVKEGDKPEIIVNHGYIYYLDGNNDIMQTSFADLTKSKTIYHSMGWINNLFNDENGVARLYFHTEGASMGSPHQFALNPNGSLKELNGSREYAGEVYSTGGKTFAFRELKFGQDSRLEMKTEDGTYVNLGGRANYYDYKSEMDGYSGRPGVYLVGDELYLLAQPFSGDAGKAVYRVNIKTDEAVRITDKASGLQIEGNDLYYNTDKEILKRNLEDGTEVSLYNFNNSATNFASDFAVLNSKLYISDRNRMFITADGEGSIPSYEEGNPIIFCSNMALRGDKGEQYLICNIGKNPVKEDGIASQWMWVYDKDGKLIMEREGDIRLNSVSIEGDNICYYNNTTNRINVEKLK
ncbi:MAG: hypothetical protein K0R19_3150 [Bacillota bacterium]|nr:hypothetical protein [Bacillota bacterium]